MSREFGSYYQGYFHTQIDQAAKDCLGGSHQITRLWGEFLQEFESISYSISSAEACDSGEYDPVLESIRKIPALTKKLDAIQRYLDPFRDVIRESIKEKLEKESTNKK